MEKEYIVSGILFSDEADYKNALRDEKNIEAISAKIDLSDPIIVLKIYNALVVKKTFKTVVGFSFLKQLRDILITNEQTADMNIDTLDYSDYFGSGLNNSKAGNSSKSNAFNTVNAAKNIKKDTESEKKLKDTVFILKCTVVVMAICMGVMFFLTLKSDTLTYNQAKDEVIDEYEKWNEELTQREKAIEMKEKEAQK